MSNRYSFCCAAGCGDCEVRLRPFEVFRSETLEGNLIEQRTVPEVVSSCCGSNVWIYDEQNGDDCGTVIVQGAD